MPRIGITPAGRSLSCVVMLATWGTGLHDLSFVKTHEASVKIPMSSSRSRVGRVLAHSAVSSAAGSPR